MIFISQAELELRWQGAHPAQGEDWPTGQRQATLQYIRTFSYQPVWASLLQNGPGVIEGQLLQGTAGGPALPQADVTLNIYQQTELLATRAATVDADGGFRFEALPLDVGYYFLVETDYGGIRYTSPILAFSGPDFSEFRVGPNQHQHTAARVRDDHRQPRRVCRQSQLDRRTRAGFSAHRPGIHLWQPL